jgi:hypothetical protein
LLEGEPQRFAAAVPELVGLAVAAYFGEEAGGEEVAERGASGVERR